MLVLILYREVRHFPLLNPRREITPSVISRLLPEIVPKLLGFCFELLQDGSPGSNAPIRRQIAFATGPNILNP
jgi:hypothetical protein